MQSRVLTPSSRSNRSNPRPTTLAELIDRTPELPAMPTVALAAYRETKRDDASSGSVATLMATDPVLAARVLRLANSAQFGAEREVASVSEAVTRLGMTTVRNLCLMGGTYPWLKAALPSFGLRPGELLAHSLATAVGARAIASSRSLDGDAAFTAGLLHDLGKVVLAPWLRGVVVRNRTDERRHLGFDHAQAGGELARRWNLPLPLAGAIACHHIPCEGLEDAVHAGNVMAHMLAGKTPSSVDVEALGRCRLSDPAAMAARLKPEVERHLKIVEACA